MTVTNAYASLAVRDLAASTRWYEAVLGPGLPAIDDVVEWHFPDGGGLQVYALPERAGTGSCTLLVRDLGETGEHLRDVGVADEATARRVEGVDVIMIRDPDGNSLAFVAGGGTSSLWY